MENSLQTEAFFRHGQDTAGGFICLLKEHSDISMTVMEGAMALAQYLPYVQDWTVRMS